MNTEELLKMQSLTPAEVFARNLASYTVVDIGVINSVDANGKATVTSSRSMGAHTVVFTGVEIIGIGDATAGLYSATANSACLIFFPRGCMPSIDDLKVRWDALVYDKNGIKALPISTGKNASIRTVVGNDEIQVQCSNYTVSFSKALIQVNWKDLFTMNVDNTELYMKYIQAVGIIEEHSNIEGYMKRYFHVDTSWSYKTRIDAEGNFTLMQHVPEQDAQGVEQDGKIRNQLLVDKEGAVTITNSDADGNVLNQLAIDSEGAVTLTMAKDVNIELTEGNITLNVKGNTSVKANGDVSVEGNNILIKAATKTEIKGGQVVLGGTVTPSGKGALCGLPNCAFTGAPHIGDISTGA